MSRFNSTTGSLDSLSDMDLPTFDGGDDPMELSSYAQQSESEIRDAASPAGSEASYTSPDSSATRNRRKVTQTAADKSDSKTAAVKPAKSHGFTRRIFADGRARMFVGIVLIIIAVYLTISTIGYLTTGAADQSAVTNNSLSALAQQDGSVKNAGGPVGAWASNALFSSTLGVAGFIMIFYIGALGLTLLKVMKFKFWNLTAKCLVSTIAVSIILGLATYDHEGFIYWGGKHGYYINKLLIAYSGIVGAISISVIMGALMLLIFLPFIQNAWNFIYVQIQKRTARIKAMKARHAAQHPKAETPSASKPAENISNDNEVAASTSTLSEADSYAQEMISGINIPSYNITDYPQTSTIDSAGETEDIKDNIDAPDVDADNTTLTDATSELLSEEFAPAATPTETFSISTGEIEVAKTVEQEPYDPTADLQIGRAHV